MKLGVLYRVKFWDHSCGDSEIVKCDVVGWLVDICELHHVFSHWILDTDDYDDFAANIEKTSIVTSCIISYEKL